MGAAGGVLIHGEQTGHSRAAFVFGAHRMAGPLGRDHEHVEIGARQDQVEMDVEAMGEGERGALPEIIAQVVFIDRTLQLVGRQHHDHVGPFGGLVRRHHRESGAFGLGLAGRAGAQGHHQLADPAVAQVQGMGVALAAIADDSNFLAGDQVEIGVAIIIDAHGGLLSGIRFSGINPPGIRMLRCRARWRQRRCGICR